MKGPLAGLMQQAQKMQDELKKAQEEVAGIEVVGESGGGMVKVTMTGAHEARRVEIDRQLFSEDPEMAEDLVTAAINDAVNKVTAQTQERMSNVASGMKLPPGMKLPF